MTRSNGDVTAARTDLAWIDAHPVDEQTVAMIADEIAPDDSYLNEPDALVVTIERELDSAVVSGEDTLTHPETKRVVDIGSTDCRFKRIGLPGVIAKKGRTGLLCSDKKDAASDKN